jgi:hypothetical protein
LGAGVGSTATVPTGDDAAVYGVPNLGKAATLMAWGVQTIAADTLYETQLVSQDMPDPLNGEWYNHGTTSLLAAVFNLTSLPYRGGPRKIALRQNTGAGVASPYTIDYVPKGESINIKRVAYGKSAPNITTFGALTAQNWGTIAFNPTNALPAGRYAILGAKCRTFTDVALLRFTHADFQGAHPGFPVVDSQLSLATSLQLTDRNNIFYEQGHQFIYLSEVTGQPMCPVISVGDGSTGLVIEALSVIADTPVVNVVLAKL